MMQKPTKTQLKQSVARRGERSYRIGLSAEAQAETLLTSEGWEILLRRARTARGEIDLVISREGKLAFVEVKARASLAVAAMSVTSRQQARIMGAAEALLASHPHWRYEEISFDVIVIDGHGRAAHIHDAFRLQ
ncbi:hypothetical protein AA23498_1828 [Acetobacter nitrogenifigens DSM 23921 = NBRC 105050]|nr:YraN family protein [Acetobacter nitrogenifigens]GBQ93770.1 hypothetical protein AA23498_1828 [Acetobacter nitrogenifigens DSM 23921 = NBRC 105050]